MPGVETGWNRVVQLGHQPVVTEKGTLVSKITIFDSNWLWIANIAFSFLNCLITYLSQGPKLFLYGSPNSCATYANSILGYTGRGNKSLEIISVCIFHSTIITPPPISPFFQIHSGLGPIQFKILKTIKQSRIVMMKLGWRMRPLWKWSSHIKTFPRMVLHPSMSSCSGLTWGLLDLSSTGIASLWRRS